MPTLAGRRIVVGVTGSIAAYKAAELVSAIRQRDAEVWVVMTENAQQFITPTTFRALSGRDVATSMFGGQQFDIEHIALADFAETVIVAPATANLLGKMAAGIADDILTTNLLAVTCPVVVAPAMNERMWASAAVQANVALLRERGVIVLEPEEGFLACGHQGKGRLPSLERLLAAVRAALAVADRFGKESPLAGKKVIVTAGPTREHIDPVRFISNPSTGAMGFALAVEAMARGAQVTLVHGPTSLPEPPLVECVAVTSAAEMAEAVLSRIDDCAVYISAAAVADYTPASPAESKIHKDAEQLTLHLVRTVDIISRVKNKRSDAVVVGFAAETERLRQRAEEKLREKNLDVIAANDVSTAAAYGPGRTELLIMTRDGQVVQTGRVFKDEAASVVLDAVERLLVGGPSSPLASATA